MPASRVLTISSPSCATAWSKMRRVPWNHRFGVRSCACAPSAHAKNSAIRLKTRTRKRFIELEVSSRERRHARACDPHLHRIDAELRLREGPDERLELRRLREPAFGGGRDFFGDIDVCS